MPAHNRNATTYGSAHQREAARLKRHLQDGDPCCRCGDPMYRWQLDLDRNDINGIDADHHEQARILGGQLPDALAHRRCNRAAGARLGNQLRGQKTRRPLPQW